MNQSIFFSILIFYNLHTSSKAIFFRKQCCLNIGLFWKQKYECNTTLISIAKITSAFDIFCKTIDCSTSENTFLLAHFFKHDFLLSKQKSVYSIPLKCELFYRLFNRDLNRKISRPYVDDEDLIIHVPNMELSSFPNG